MKSYDEYYIPENIQDELLCSVAAMVKEVLRENDILENIFRKYIVAYNSTLKERCSAKSLQVMNQNHKPIFSTITPSGVIKSPRCSSMSTKKDAKLSWIKNQQLHTPLKTNRINSKTERKRLSFDIAEDKDMKSINTFTKDSDECRMMFTNPKEERSIGVTIGDINTVQSSDTGPSFFNYEQEAKLCDSSEDRFNLQGNLKCIATLPVYGQYAANLSTNIPAQDQMMVLTPKSEIGMVDEIKDGWYLKCRPSVFTYEKVFKPSDTPNMIQKVRYSLDGKPETITSKDVFDHGSVNQSTKTPDNNQNMITSPEKKNRALVNDTIGDRNSTRCLTTRSSFFTYRKAKISNILNTNEKKSFRPYEKHETVPILPGDHLVTSCISHKTPDNLQTLTVDVCNEERIPKNQDLLKKLTVEMGPNYQDFLASMKNVNLSNSPKMKRQKFIDNSDETITTISLESNDKEICYIPGSFKIDRKVLRKNKRTGISDDSTSPTHESSMDKTIIYHKTHDSTMDDDSLNSPNEDFMDEQDVFQADGKTIKTNFLINRNKGDVASVSLAKKRLAHQSSITQDCAYISPQDDQNKITVSIKSDISNSKNLNSSVVAHETKDVKFLTNAMQNLSPSAKRFSDGTFQKSMTDRSLGEEVNLSGQLRLQDNQSKISTPPREYLISNIKFPKPDGTSDTQAIKFIEMLTTRVTSFLGHFSLFVEDDNDTKFICGYMNKMAAVIEKIPVDENNEVALKALNTLGSKARKLLKQLISWEVDIKKDLAVWEDCLKKIKLIQQDVMRYFGEEKVYTASKEFQKWEESFRTISKKANDMTLLREIRKPTVLHFGYELENCIQLFIRYMLVVGLLKHSSKVF